MPDPLQSTDNSDFDLVPVDHDPFAPVPKAGQTVQQPNVMQGITSLPPQVAQFAGDVTGVSDAVKALRGQMTPEEAQNFALMSAAGVVAPELRGARAAMGVAEKVAPETTEAVTQGIRAYHGSPYDFNQFDLSKIGTGEGAQAYGHGLYFAENPATAQAYKESLTRSNRDLLKDYYANYEPTDTVTKFAKSALLRDGDPVNAKFVASNWQMPEGVSRDDVYAAIDDIAAKYPKPEGKTYEVNINADPEHFLDWDKPLSEQHPEVQKKLADAWLAHPEAHANQTGAQIYEATIRGAMPPKMSPVEAGTETLKEAGIPGIKYLDQGSRNQTSWIARHPQGGINDFPSEQQARAFIAKNPEYSLEPPKQTSNYVVFNDKLVDIIKKYGLAGLVVGGASHFQTTPVDHNPFADATTQGMATGGRVNAANIDANPSEAQKKAGNYRKDHVNFQGLDLTIENARGAFRSGVDKGGKPWRVKMPAHYGYIKGTVGNDKDHVDIYLGPHKTSPRVYVIDQMNAETKAFDEHKAFLGFTSPQQVKATYHKAFSDGKAGERLGNIVEMSIEHFKHWLQNGDTEKPVAHAVRK